jgi:hypothetical protein
MAYGRNLQASFTTGELSPRLLGRTDLEAYYKGVKRMENMAVLPHGGATRRPGTYFVNEVKDSAKFVRLIPFEYSTLEAYVLEFGDQYIRFHANHGTVMSDGAPYEIASPYTEADLDLLKFTQSSDVLYLSHPAWAPRRLVRNGATDWDLEILDFEDGPYLDENKTDTTLTPSATSGGSVTVTASSTDGINDGAGFQSTDNGRIIRINNPASGNKWGWGVITNVTSTTVVTVNVREDFAATTATKKWRLGAWSETTGWPEVVTLADQRLVFGNTESEPSRFWASKVSDLEVFSPTETDGTVTAANAITYSIADDQVNAIRWMSAGDGIAIGTAAAEYVFDGGGIGAPLSPLTPRLRRQTTWGAFEYTRAIRVGHQVLFAQRAGRKIREFVYDYDVGGYVAADITALSEHITRGQVFDMAFCQEPDQVVWLSRGDGLLVGMTYQKENDVIAWHRHILGGHLNGANAVVESLASIPTPDGTANELWMVVARTINGANKRYIEYLTQPFSTASMEQGDAYFVDCGLSYDGESKDTFGGLEHLEGEELSVLADGAVHPPVKVTGGEIKLTKPASKVHAGLGYLSVIETLPAESGSPQGTAQGRQKRVVASHINFFETLGCLYGQSAESLDRLPFRKASDHLGEPPALFSGFKEVSMQGGYGVLPTVLIAQDQPLPMTILSVVQELQTHG